MCFLQGILWTLLSTQWGEAVVRAEWGGARQTKLDRDREREKDGYKEIEIKNPLRAFVVFSTHKGVSSYKQLCYMQNAWLTTIKAWSACNFAHTVSFKAPMCWNFKATIINIFLTMDNGSNYYVQFKKGRLNKFRTIIQLICSLQLYGAFWHCFGSLAWNFTLLVHSHLSPQPKTKQIKQTNKNDTIFQIVWQKDDENIRRSR